MLIVSAGNETITPPICYDGVVTTTISNLAETAALIGEPARTAMLYALMDGRALTAGELARSAGVLPPTASGHLGQLREAGMLSVERQGRHQYYRLASTDIAAVLEALLVVTDCRQELVRPKPVVVGPKDTALRHARICYDHLAGALGVAIFEALVAQDQLRLGAGGTELTDAGTALLAEIGIVSGHEPPRTGTRLSCRACLDWSERRPHLAGKIGAAICTVALENDWLKRSEGSRALRLTPFGKDAFHRHFGIAFP